MFSQDLIDVYVFVSKKAYGSKARSWESFGSALEEAAKTHGNPDHLLRHAIFSCTLALGTPPSKEFGKAE